MGLDTVELLMEIEQWFGIHISNAEAEKIATLHQMTDCVAAHLGISSTTQHTKEQVAMRLHTALNALGEESLQRSELLFQKYPPDRETWWQKLEASLGLDIPRAQYGKASKRSALMRFILTVPAYDPGQITADHFLDVLCLAHYDVLFPQKQLASRYDIYIVVAGLTCEKTGIDPYEIYPESSFTDDLGMD